MNKQAFMAKQSNSLDAKQAQPKLVQSSKQATINQFFMRRRIV